MPSRRQIHKFLGLGGGVGEQRVAAGSGNHTVGEVALGASTVNFGNRTTTYLASSTYVDKRV